MRPIVPHMFLRFCLVGAIGTGVNLCVYTGLTFVIRVNVILASCLAFITAVTSNYVLNAKWTFGTLDKRSPLIFTQFVGYIVANIIGLLVNLGVLTFVIRLAGDAFHLLGQLIGILCGMSFNYSIAKRFIFAKVRAG